MRRYAVDIYHGIVMMVAVCLVGLCYILKIYWSLITGRWLRDDAVEK